MNELEAYRTRARALDLQSPDHVIVADLGEQILRLHETRSGSVLGEWPVSSGKRPRSCRQDSLGTPWGLHEVAEKYGDNAPPGMVFKGRVATGRRWQDLPEEADATGSLVTTRILRLRGLEPGLNAGPGVDSYDRYIYIHGTNRPGAFPQNISSGCLLMRDPDLLALYESVPTGTHVWIPA